MATVARTFLLTPLSASPRTNPLLSSHAYTYRKEGHTKVIEYDLSVKQKAQLARRRPDVLLAEKAGNLVRQRDEDIDMDASETGQGEEKEDGEDDEEEEEEDEDEGDGDEIAGPPKPKEPQLPRAANGKIKTSRGRNERVVAPEECRAHLRRLFHNEAMMCSLLFGRHGPFAPISKDQLSFASADMFFLDVIPVAPTRFRPPAKLGEVLFEHPQNELLSKVLNTSYRMRDLNLDLRAVSQKTGSVDEGARKTLMSALLDRLVQLQVDVNSFMDSSKNPAPVRQSKLPPAGVKQGLEKKEGLFRKHMMVRPTFCGMILLL